MIDPTPKPWYLSKTMAFNLITIAVMVAGAFGFSEFTADAWTTEVVTVLVALINIGLRFVTKAPLA